MTNPVNLLVIDADEANRNFLAQLLHKKNYQVRQASSGEEGIRMVREAAPNMVIFDTGLPDLRATDLIERLQHIPVIANVPCVVLTSHPDPEEMQACLQAGCAEYYVKSGMVMMTLVDAIPRLLTEGRRLRKKREQGYLIVFLSAKGGTGTSSLCANIAMNMAAQNPQAGVAVADLVLPMGTIAPLVGIQDPKINLVSVAGEPDEKINAEYLGNQLPVPPHWLFHLLPGAPDPETSINLNVSHIPNIVNALRQAYDYVLVDLGRSLSRISLPIIQAADLVVLILSTDLSTVNQTKKLWHYLREQEIHPEPGVCDHQPGGRPRRTDQGGDGKAPGDRDQPDHPVHDGQLYAGQQPEHADQRQVPHRYRHHDPQAGGGGNVAEIGESAVLEFSSDLHIVSILKRLQMGDMCNNPNVYCVLSLNNGSLPLHRFPSRHPI